MKRVVIASLLCLFAPITVAEAGSRSEIPGPVPAVVLRVVDGDNLIVRARIWPQHEVTTSVRIRGIDTPELKSRCRAERRLAEEARAALAALVDGGDVLLSSISGDKYHGRVLATVTSAGGIDAAGILLETGHAAPYAGRNGKRDWCAVMGPGGG